MAFAQLIMSSLLLDEAEEATSAATGDPDVLRVCSELVRPRVSWERRVENWVEGATRVAGDGRVDAIGRLGGRSASSSLLSDVERKTDSAAVPGVF